MKPGPDFVKFEKPDLGRPRTLVLPGIVAALVILLFILILSGGSDSAKTGSGPAGASSPYPDSKLARGEVKVEFRRFTHWMTPEEIDAHIRLLTGSAEKGFWDQGHWILAAEGRWKDGVHQFRIAYDKSPPEGEFSWQYKINQTQLDYSKSIDQFLGAGYTLVHSQSFTRPDDTKRYQGVWHRVSPAALPGNEKAYEEKAENSPDRDSPDRTDRSRKDEKKKGGPLSRLNNQDFRDASRN